MGTERLSQRRGADAFAAGQGQGAPFGDSGSRVGLHQRRRETPTGPHARLCRLE